MKPLPPAVVQEKGSTGRWGMMYPLEGATLQEVHHDPPIQKTSTLALRMQVPSGLLSEIPVQNAGRQSSRIGEGSNLWIVPAEGSGRSNGIERATRSRASGGVSPAEVGGVQFRRLSERQTGDPDV